MSDRRASEGDRSDDTPRPETFEELARRAQNGDREAANTAFTALLDELRRAARSILRSGGPRASVETDDLVGGAVVKYDGALSFQWSDPNHFVAAMSRAMRQYFLDRLRGKSTDKRKEKGRRRPLSGIDVAFLDDSYDLARLHEALAKLERAFPETALCIEHRYFLKIPVAEIAARLRKSPRTIEREIKFGLAFLRKELEG